MSAGRQTFSSVQEVSEYVLNMIAACKSGKKPDILPLYIPYSLIQKADPPDKVELVYQISLLLEKGSEIPENVQKLFKIEVERPSHPHANIKLTANSWGKEVAKNFRNFVYWGEPAAAATAASGSGGVAKNAHPIQPSSEWKKFHQQHVTLPPPLANRKRLSASSNQKEADARGLRRRGGQALVTAERMAKAVARSNATPITDTDGKPSDPSLKHGAPVTAPKGTPGPPGHKK